MVDGLIRSYYMTFSISALVSAWDSHIKSYSEAGGLIWVEGRYQGRYGKFNVIIYLSHILHWLFPSIDFYIADKIFELTNCKNKFLRELPFVQLANIFVSSLGSKRYQTTSICTMALENGCKIYPRRWHFSQLFRIKLFPIFRNVLIWLKYDLMHIFIHHLFLYFDI